MKPWRTVLRLLAYRPWLVAACFLSWVLISLTPTGLGLVARSFFNALSGSAPALDSLWLLAVLPVAVQSGRLLVTWLSVPVSVLQRFTVSALLTTNMLEQILRRPGARALPGSTGDAISRFRDDADAVALFASMITVISAVAEALSAGVTLGLMLHINAFVTVAAVLPLVGVMIVAKAAGQRIGRYRDRSRTAAARVTGMLGEIFTMVPALKLAGAEANVAGHLRRLGDQRRAHAVQDSLFTELLRSVYLNTANLGTGLVLLLAAGSMRSGTFTVGDFALFAAYVGRLAGFTGVVGDLLASYKQMGVSLRRMQALLEDAPAVALAAHSPLYLDTPLPERHRRSLQPEERLNRLEVEDLTYEYPDSGRGVRGATFTLTRGTLTVITGRVGSGKSTLLRALLGLLPAQGGAVHWNGRVVDHPGSFFQPPISSYTPQVPVLFSATLKENILLGLPEAEADLAGAVHAAVLEQDVAGLEKRLETEVGARGVKLSGGQVQRTAAARMFVREPELLVFDDLSSALDEETEEKLWERLRARKETTCLAVSHRPAVLEAADQILLMSQGRVEMIGTAPQLLAASDEFRAILEGDRTH
ncbi:MAG: transporter ATP-binding protein [Symbiobacteriaceae bacterium]|jgi:ATP-binding cassette subfamily B protein|nr:transporter ATP-binding protein [Symbiobacteriaceae bacterium]